MSIRKALCCLAVIAGASVAHADKPAVFRPKPTNEVLYNPHMGFQTFQRFNGDPLHKHMWGEIGPEEFSPPPASLENKDYPFTTVAYCRWYWDTIEPEDGGYRWEIIDGALKSARERGQTLAIRVMCHDSGGWHDVPKWLKDKGARGAVRDGIRGHMKYWLPDYSDPLYIQYWTRLTKKLAERYDGHPDLECVDIASIGPWGEWSTKPVDPRMETKAALIDCYTDNFRKTPLLMQFDDAPSLAHAIGKGTGWRADCLGDMGLWGPEWCHMIDFYPQGIVYGGASDAWKTAPVAFEVCRVMGEWYEKEWDVDYIFDQAVKWHTTYINAKSSPIPEAYGPAVESLLKRIGYRHRLRRFACSPKVLRGAEMKFNTWWENEGCAPIYRRYDLALQFKSSETSFTLKTDADITKWLPGDIIYDSSVPVPDDIEPGIYLLRVGLLHPTTGEPRIQLAQEGRAEDGWYNLGEIEIVSEDSEPIAFTERSAP
ncbi:MAG: DUF4832 domain-containing protein [Planctomycetota bacterium]|jgi:hypothetical protein